MPTRTFGQQKAALTRAVKSQDHEKLIAECRRVKSEWNESYWPDDWSRWQRALDDVIGYPEHRGSTICEMETGDSAARSRTDRHEVPERSDR